MLHHAQVELMLADGSLLVASRRSHGDVFPGLLVSIGALGVMTALTFRCERAFKLHAISSVRSPPPPRSRGLAAPHPHHHYGHNSCPAPAPFTRRARTVAAHLNAGRLLTAGRAAGEL